MSENIKKALLIKLMKRRCWGHKHTSYDNLPKGFPSHLAKDVKRIADELIKEEFLLSHPTEYGTEVSLNPRMKKEIEEIIFS
jgi:hypothetical protein